MRSSPSMKKMHHYLQLFCCSFCPCKHYQLQVGKLHLCQSLSTMANDFAAVFINNITCPNPLQFNVHSDKGKPLCYSIAVVSDNEDRNISTK